MSKSQTLKDKEADCLLAGSRGDHLSHDSWHYRLNDVLHLLRTQHASQSCRRVLFTVREQRQTSPSSRSSKQQTAEICTRNNLIFKYILMRRNVCPPRQLLNSKVFRTHHSRLLVLPNSALVAGKDHFHHRVPPKLPPLATACWKVGSIKRLS